MKQARRPLSKKWKNIAKRKLNKQETRNQMGYIVATLATFIMENQET
jgi:hypothetical protein